MKKILVVDWLDKYGGAERVISVLQYTLNFSQTYTLVNIMKERDLEYIYPNQGKNIYTTSLQITKKYFRVLFFFFPYFISKIKIDTDTNLIVSSSHAVAKGVKKTHPNQIHICYLQARNFKYIWEEANLYFKGFEKLLQPFFSLLRKIDVKQAQQPDYIISNSKFVQSWVKNNYNRESVVIYPPVDLSQFYLHSSKKDYYVTVGRIVSYKRFDIIIDAFNNNKKQLIVIGDGNKLAKLKSMAKSNIQFKGFLSSEEINSYIGNAKCFIHAGVEDFGIAPLEAQACGTPVIAYGKGGVLETIIENQTGLFFDQQTPESLNQTIDRFETLKFDPIEIRKHALQFSEERFVTEINAFIEAKCT